MASASGTRYYIPTLSDIVGFECNEPYNHINVDFRGKEYQATMDGDQLTRLGCENWVKNRGLSKEKCREIAQEYILRSRMDGVIYIVINTDDKFVKDGQQPRFIYDGAHRARAIELLLKEGKNILTTVNILTNCHEFEVEKRFKLLGKAEPVSELKLECMGVRDSKKGETLERFEETVETIMTEYEKCGLISHKRSSHKSRTTRTYFKNALKRLADEYPEMMTYTVEQIQKILDNFNDEFKKDYDDGYQLKLTPQQRAKCETTGVYLFMYKNWDSEIIRRLS